MRTITFFANVLRRRVWFGVLGLFLLLNDSYAQSGRDLRNEILIYIKPQVLEFPLNERQAVTFDRVIMRSEPLLNAFARFRAQTIAKAFPDFTDADTVRRLNDGRVVSISQFSRIFRVRLQQSSDVDSAVSSLSKIQGILFAEKHAEGHVHGDPMYVKQWHLNNTGLWGGTAGADIKADSAWQIFTGSSNVKIGVIDVGVEITHNDLDSKASGDTPDAGGDHHRSHGTHVAGIAAAEANNDIGGRGVDWYARIISRRAFNSFGYTLGDDVIGNAVTSAVDAGANVLNNSYGVDWSTTLRLALAYAYKMNVVAVAAMGNGYPSNPENFPAGFEQGIIAVGATTDEDRRSGYSQTGNHIDVVAPGGINEFDYRNQHDIWSTWVSNTYDWDAGTSMAAPQVSGIASLLKGYNSNLYNDDIEHLVQLCADKVRTDLYTYDSKGWNIEMGYGRVNARKALDYLRSPYVLTQTTATGGTDQGASEMYGMTIYGAQAYGLSDGYYLVKRHEVRKTINYSSLTGAQVWGRGVATTGWNHIADQYVNFGLGYCVSVPGTVTSTSATLQTFVYEVFIPVWPFYPLGWYPTTPNNVVYAYTTWGIPVPLAVSISGPTDVYHPAHGQPAEQGIWTANVSGGFPPYSYVWSDHGYGTAQSYTEYFSYDGTGGGTTQFTLRVDVTDAASQQANSSMVVTEHHSGEVIDPIANPSNGDALLIPTKFEAGQNYPNPFNPETRISFGLPEPADVTITISDLLGREIISLASGRYSAGYQAVTWRGTDASGNKVGSGIYFYRVSAVGESGKRFSKVMKMLLAK